MSTTDFPDAMNVPEPDTPFMRVIKTYVLRAGRMGPGQTRAFEQFGAKFLLPFKNEKLDLVASFGRQAPLILEIGFGMGDATAKIAKRRAGDNFLCCEVHEPGVGALLKRMGELDLNNIRILQHDAVEVIEHMLPAESLDGVHIFFPDPWHKLRHNKRRLIQTAFVHELVKRLKPGGYIHCATDWQPYAEHILKVMQSEPGLINRSQRADSFSDQPIYRPLTKFENRGLKLGHGVWDLVFERR